MSEATEVNKVREHIMEYQRRKECFYQKIADFATLGIPDSYVFSKWQVTVWEAKVFNDFSIVGLEAKMNEYKLQRLHMMYIHRSTAFAWYVMFGKTHTAIGPPGPITKEPVQLESGAAGFFLSKKNDHWIVIRKDAKRTARILVEGRDDNARSGS